MTRREEDEGGDSGRERERERGREGEINDHGVRVGRQKCQSVFTEAHYSCFQTHKLSPGEQITGATQQQPTCSHSCMVAFFFPLRDLALIHSHSSDVLTPKGPCPAVTEQLPPTSNPHHLSYRPACSAKKQTEDSCSAFTASSYHLFSSE